MSATTESLDSDLSALSILADDLINLLRSAHTIGSLYSDEARVSLCKSLVHEAAMLADHNAEVVNRAMDHAALLKIPAPTTKPTKQEDLTTMEKPPVDQASLTLVDQWKMSLDLVRMELRDLPNLFSSMRNLLARPDVTATTDDSLLQMLRNTVDTLEEIANDRNDASALILGPRTGDALLEDIAVVRRRFIADNNNASRPTR